jgi:Holliday junction resolvase RusA-like endonuclease
MNSITFSVLGQPVPQGSKRGFARGGKVVMLEMGKNLQPWRQEIAVVASQHMGSESPWLGPIRVKLTFFIPRPKGHYGTGRNATTLKASAPRFPISSPDLDKLTRAVLDALTGIAYRDDAQVHSLDTMKLYADDHYAGVVAEVIHRVQ